MKIIETIRREDPDCNWIFPMLATMAMVVVDSVSLLCKTGDITGAAIATVGAALTWILYFPIFVFRNGLPPEDCGCLSKDSYALPSHCGKSQCLQRKEFEARLQSGNKDCRILNQIAEAGSHPCRLRDWITLTEYGQRIEDIRLGI